MISYYGVDLAVREKPHVAVAGQAYRLVAKPNCRYSSGECVLRNGDLNVTLVFDTRNKQFTLKSSHQLQQAVIGISESTNDETAPVPMQSLTEDKKSWVVKYAQNIKVNHNARLVLRALDAYYYAETPLHFIEYAASFNKDLRQNIE